MSVAFYDTRGGMLGCDLHEYVAYPAEPIPSHPHIVGAFFDGPGTDWKRTASVRSEGHPMIQRGHDWLPIAHMPIPLPPPSPLEIPVAAWILVTSSSKARMAVHSVTGQGTPLATCLGRALGLNVNCGRPFAMPTGFVVNPNSVQTTPTLGDYLGALAGYVLDAALGVVMGRLFGKVGDKLLQFALRWLFRHRSKVLKDLGVDLPKVLSDPASILQDIVQKFVDGRK